MGNPAGYIDLFGVRSLDGDSLALMRKRLPDLPKRQRADEPLAVNALEAVLAGYGERGQDALRHAQLEQGDVPLQYLDDGRFFDNRFSGVSRHDHPLILYRGSKIPGTRGSEGLFRSTPDGRASIQVAMGSPSPLSALLEEVRHAMDRQLDHGERAHSMRADSVKAEMMGAMNPSDAEAMMEYYSLPSEVRATLSGLLAQSPDLVTSARQAEDLLESARTAGDVRERATATGILNSRAMRNEYIPYLMKALSAGGIVMQGEE